MNFKKSTFTSICILLLSNTIAANVYITKDIVNKCIRNIKREKSDEWFVAYVGQNEFAQEAMEYSPSKILINAGDTVKWHWNTTVPHSVTHQSYERESMFDSGVQGKGFIYSVQFNETGSFDFYCTIHEKMRGVVIVS